MQLFIALGVVVAFSSAWLLSQYLSGSLAARDTTPLEMAPPETDGTLKAA